MAAPSDEIAGPDRSHHAGDSPGYRFLHHGSPDRRRRLQRPPSPAVELHLSEAAQEEVADHDRHRLPAPPTHPPEAPPASLHLEA